MKLLLKCQGKSGKGRKVQAEEFNTSLVDYSWWRDLGVRSSWKTDGAVKKKRKGTFITRTVASSAALQSEREGFTWANAITKEWSFGSKIRGASR